MKERKWSDSLTMKQRIHFAANHFWGAVTFIHPNWKECRGSSIVMVRAQRVLNNHKSTIAEIKKAGRSLHRLWSEFKDEFSSAHNKFLNDRAKLFH